MGLRPATSGVDGQEAEFSLERARLKSGGCKAVILLAGAVNSMGGTWTPTDAEKREYAKAL
jgi:hypothetical protein